MKPESGSRYRIWFFFTALFSIILIPTFSIFPLFHPLYESQRFKTLQQYQTGLFMFCLCLACRQLLLRYNQQYRLTLTG